MQSLWWRVDEPGDAGRMTAPAPPAAKRQLGFVRLWPARAVDVRLFWGALAPTARKAPEGEGGAAEELRRDEPDDFVRRLALVLQAPPELWLRDSGALEWVGELYPYQKEGVLALLESPRLLLGDEMGLGKSVQAVAALRILLHRREIERGLVVVPASLLEQWRREWRKWAPEIVVMPIAGAARDRRWQWRYRAHVTLVSYDTLRADAGLRVGPMQQSWGAVVLDEAQRIKNPESEIALLCKKLPRVRSVALTGTPVENRAEDLSSILEFLSGRRVSGVALRSVLRELLVRRRKSEVLAELPPKITIDLPVPLSAEQRQAYDLAREEGTYSLRSGPVTIESVLALLTRLKQICNFDPRTGTSAKLEDLCSRLSDIGETGQKSLIFTQFSGDSGARRLAGALPEWNPLLFTGDLSPRERNAVLDQFEQDENARVLVLSLKAGSQGLNLQHASYVFHFDRWWNPATEAQAESRAHRLGQAWPVHVYRYITPDTIEEEIDAVLRQKAALFEELIEDASLDAAIPWTQDELFRLAGLR